MPADRSSSVSRRSFLRIATAAAAVPIMTEAHLAWAYSTGAQSASSGLRTARRFHGGIRPVPPDAILINANENPLGPCKLACEACSNITPNGGRYDFEQTINSGNLCLTHYRFLLDPRWSSTKSSPSVCAWHVSLVNWTRFENGRLTGSSLSLINAD